MLGGMLVLGAVTAADTTADETQSQLHPRITDSQTLLAAGRCLRLHFLRRDFCEMLARCFHISSSYESIFSVANKRYLISRPLSRSPPITSQAIKNSREGSLDCQ